MKIENSPPRSDHASGDVVHEPVPTNVPQAPKTADTAGPLSGLKRRARRAFPGTRCPGSTKAAAVGGTGSATALTTQTANQALAAIDMALSMPGEKVTVDLQHRRPDQTCVPEQRSSSDVQLSLRCAEEKGARTTLKFQIESSRFHTPGFQTIATHGPHSLLRAATLAALAPGMQGLDHMITTLAPPQGARSGSLGG
ncbi:hypothetical protein [Xanthomonas vasicola]|uniref:hypothetical protein n=1 Tax=Xanthomonas vasicola TaxID=56459 RepID=UPI0001CC0442|nr:hypothetical protein [Xanthomonas vasicola]KFA27297.1 hypothetical protein KWS_0118055 [Xanthomonas vasicola pv. musacearum NCPPB 4384]AZR32754.1 hypothetical protein KWO_021965 [Xanthomonas vasicola pv. musacearum NCPPB 4379]KFA25614.1 hypothetical protein KWU_0102365 [Xanthomonas vasicola pv. musacearum NCPPB 4394]MBV6743042.1 hypothetical protein [Xanthomonas vasicola pv. musacearum NCPPB 2251]MBV7279361.1 hypothetical protein [Xanthomonas vasicola pv. musacearum]